jgi:hypothetical protein
MYSTLQGAHIFFILPPDTQGLTMAALGILPEVGTFFENARCLGQMQEM